MQNNSKDKNSVVVTNEDLQAALANPTIKGILARVYKIFLVSYGKHWSNVWDKLMDTYVTDPNNNIPNDRAKQTSAKGNMKREYLGPNLTFVKFCEAMRFAQFKELEMIFTATDENGVKHRLKEEINFENINSSEFEIDDFLKSTVTTVDSSLPQSDGEVINAMDMIYKKPRQRQNLSQGKDWVSLPTTTVNSIIEENTIK